MLPTGELSDIRTEAALALPDTCTIQTRTQTNTKGSVADTYANTYTSVSCRLAGANRVVVERLLGAAMAADVDMILTVKFDQTVTPKDRVVHNSVTYEVVAVSNDNASWRSTRRVYLKRIQ